MLVNIFYFIFFWIIQFGRQINIKLIYTKLQEELNKPNASGQINFELFNTIISCLEEAKNAISKLINLNVSSSGISLNTEQLNEIKNATKYEDLPSFYNEDLLILITISSAFESGYFVIPKILIKNSNRPIVGTIFLRIYYIETLHCSNEYKKSFMTSAFIHEIIHILGFMSDCLFAPPYRDWLKTKNVNRISGKNMNKTIIGSPKLLEVAKKYYNCSTIEGIELESSNEANLEGIYNSHWEERLLLGDLMTPNTYYQEQIISEFTLALLEDSGWYTVNYYTGGLMKFGKNKGCDFIQEDCFKKDNSGYFTTPFKNEFCHAYKGSAGNTGSCSSGRLSRGYCNNRRTLPDNEKIYYERQNYSIDPYNNLKGYGNNYAEYCPINFNSINDYENYYMGNCLIGNNSFGQSLGSLSDYQMGYKHFNNMTAEKFTNESFCAMSSIYEKNNNIQNIYKLENRPSCFRMICRSHSLTIELYSTNSNYSEYLVCPLKGGKIEIEGDLTKFEGNLFCPDYYSICSGTTTCNNIIDCINHKSSTKEESYYYTANNYSNADISIFVDNIIYYNDIGFEQSDDGKCPIDCRICIENKQCILCKNDSFDFLGEKYNDSNPITCNVTTKPLLGYYLSSKHVKNKTYFKCIENCYKCQEATKDKCDQCSPTHFIDISNNSNCKNRIDHCVQYDSTTSYIDSVSNGGGEAYKECLNCDNVKGYYCLNGNRTKCEKIDDYSPLRYYNLSTSPSLCIRNCSDEYIDCVECNNITCTKCKSDKEYIINDFGNCIEKIKNCKDQKMDINDTECNECEDNYNCIGNNKNSCINITNRDFYFELNNSCFEKCDNKFDNCSKCNSSQCLECQNGFFLYRGRCEKNITGCIDNIYDGSKKECNLCNKNENYYCLNKNRDVCHKKSSSEISFYYQTNETSYPCYEKCDTLFENCIQCNYSNCQNCSDDYIINNDENKCLTRPFKFVEDDVCKVNIHQINKTIYEIDFWDDFIDYYFFNIPYVKLVEHFVGNNYTVTIFVDSECTEDLYNEGYFKINSKELENTMVRESKVEGLKILFSIFVSYNHKNHFRFHNFESLFLNPQTKCPSCVNMNYTIKSKFTESINEALGQVVTKLAVNEELDIFNKEADFYHEICENVTFHGIDLPLKRRLNYLYKGEYKEQILCNWENCTLVEYSLENDTSVCSCTFGNKFEDILKATKLEFIPYDEEIKSNDFLDSIKIIKCTSSGFKSENLKSNVIGFIVLILAIVGQVVLFIVFFFCNEPLVSMNKRLSNPPKVCHIRLCTEWNTKMKNYPTSGQIFIQPRDDADEQLLEEEKSFGDDLLDSSYLTLDTKLVQSHTRNIKNKKPNEKDKRFLILLKNRKNKSDDNETESELEIPLDDSINASKEIKPNICMTYWIVLSLKQHIINYFSGLNCARITVSYIPLSVRFMRSIFLFILSFLLNIIWLDQSYYEEKFDHFNEKYQLILAETDDISISTSEKVSYAFKHAYPGALISFCIVIIVQLLLGLIFFSLRGDIKKVMKRRNIQKIQNLNRKVKIKYIVFFILSLALLLVFFFAIMGFCGAYGGGFVDYAIAGLITLICLEVFPFIWSIIIALFKYFGNNLGRSLAELFMF